VLSGPDFRRAYRNPAPVGNIDICPTLCHLLGLPSGSRMEGRILGETLAAAEAATPEWDTWEEHRAFAARGREWRQRVWFERTAGTSYLAGGTVEPA
jgi:arylsulfatase A-like enzyme